MINVAIVGCGRVADNHADAFLRLPNACLKAAMDIDAEKAKSFADRFGIPEHYSDYAQMLAHSGVDAVSLAVPHDLHGPMALEALRAGKHVLVEKPLVIDPDEGPALAREARDRGLVLMPVMQHRFDGIVKAIMDMLKSGAMGTIRLVRGHLECSRPPGYYLDSDWRGLWQREGGSVLINQAYHLLDLMTLMGGSPVHALSMMHTFQKDIMETEDVFAGVFRYATGGLGTLSICGAAGANWNSYVELLGERGLVAFDINFPNQLHRFELENKREMKHWRERFRVALAQEIEVAPGIGYYGVTHREQAAAFLSAIEGESPVEAATFDEALALVSLIQSMYSSAHKTASETAAHLGV